MARALSESATRMVAGVAMGIALWYVFDALLDVTLPLGVWLS